MRTGQVEEFLTTTGRHEWAIVPTQSLVEVKVLKIFECSQLIHAIYFR